MHEFHEADLGGEVHQVSEEIPEVVIEEYGESYADEAGELIDTSVVGVPEYRTDAESLDVAVAPLSEVVDYGGADESVQGTEEVISDQTTQAIVEQPVMRDDRNSENYDAPNQSDQTSEDDNTVDAQKARVVWQSANPDHINSYKVGEGVQYRPGEITVPEGSPLANQGLEVVTRSRVAETTDNAVLRFPGRLEVLNVESGKRELLAEAVWHESQRPQPTNVISAEGTPEIEMPERARDQRPHYLPPDEIRIDEAPSEREEVAAAVEIMLRTYVEDTMQRTTSPDPSVPGVVALKPEMRRYIDEPQLPREVFEEALLGEQPIGVTRLQLSDPQSNLDARHDNFDTPTVNGTLDALHRLHCEPVSVKSVRVESSDMRAIEIRFQRKSGTLLSPDSANNRTIAELESPPPTES